MAKQEDLFKNVVSHAKEYGFIRRCNPIVLITFKKV